MRLKPLAKSKARICSRQVSGSASRDGASATCGVELLSLTDKFRISVNIPASRRAARKMESLQSAMRSTAKSSSELTGRRHGSPRRGAISSSCTSSIRRAANVAAVKPCLRAFCAERALPAAVRGPVERTALARLASSALQMPSCEQGCSTATEEQSADSLVSSTQDNEEFS